MNIKRIFGMVLILLGFSGFLYLAEAIYSKPEIDIKSLFVYWVLSMFFFISGTSIFRTTKREI